MITKLQQSFSATLERKATVADPRSRIYDRITINATIKKCTTYAVMAQYATQAFDRFYGYDINTQLTEHLGNRCLLSGSGNDHP
ncbi:hypothetical protein AEQ67_19125 [Pseudomonas sp. RIT-PI-q]|nr:hypothetical protein AEQ67_19125 [Pseudomonas sp. RIT-PI-q]